MHLQRCYLYWIFRIISKSRFISNYIEIEYISGSFRRSMFRRSSFRTFQFEAFQTMVELFESNNIGLTESLEDLNCTVDSNMQEEDKVIETGPRPKRMRLTERQKEMVEEDGSASSKLFRRITTNFRGRTNYFVELCKHEVLCM